MPELPEVETVARNLTEILKPPFQIEEWTFFRKDLRFPIPVKKLKQKLIKKIKRRAKYLIFEAEDEVIISHLGMTGSWRVEKKGWLKRKHDHLALIGISENQVILWTRFLSKTQSINGGGRSLPPSFP